MARKRWKPRQPATMQEAIRLCLDYAEYRHNRSVARVAELIGTTEWSVYKWMAEGSIPSKRIRPLEFACGCTFITQYLAASAHRLLIEIPTGRRADQSDLLELQTTLNTAVNLLTRFYNGDAEPADVLQGVTQAMQRLAWHRENVRQTDTPELELFEEGAE